MKYWYRMEGSSLSLYHNNGICLTRNIDGLKHYFDWTGSESVFISANLISHLNVIEVHEFDWDIFAKNLVYCPDIVTEWAGDFKKAITSGNIDSVTHEWLMMTDKKKMPINLALKYVGVDGVLCSKNNNMDFPAVYIPDGGRIKIIKTVACRNKGEIESLITELEQQ